MNITLVLFDIDGTLLDAHGAGRQAFVNALASVFGWKDDIDYIRFEGSTDLDVLRRILARHGVVPTRAIEEKFFEQLPVELEKTAAATRLTIYPGVKDLLTVLAKYPRILVGLVTGNVESCARIKLKSHDLHDHFILGAFGHEHADRSQIASLALMRARKQLQRGQQIVERFLIGDTPSDIAAANAIGAKCIAVATGGHDRQSLLRAGADYALENLSDMDAVLRILQIQD